MQRVGFLLKVRHDKLEEYREAHRHVWPDMLAALSATGWTNYSLFLSPGGLLFGYLETEDFDKAVAGMASSEVNTRWQAAMAPYFEGLDGAPADKSFLRLEEVFHLD